VRTRAHWLHHGARSVAPAARAPVRRARHEVLTGRPWLACLHLQVVGDMDQQIYGFNGSSPTLESAFREHYRDRDTIGVRLDYNYRSPRNLVALADAFIQATLQREQTVPPTAVEPDGKPLRIVECVTEVHEQALLVELVKKLQDRGVGAPPA
jgi:superfamily I DNA/RNA helicase